MRIDGNLNSLLGIHKLDGAEAKRLSQATEAEAIASTPENDSSSLRRQVQLFEASSRLIQDHATVAKILDQSLGQIDGRLANMQNVSKVMPSDDLASFLSTELQQVRQVESQLGNDLGVSWSSQSLADAVQKGDRASILLTLAESRDELSAARAQATEARSRAIQHGIKFLSDHVTQLPESQDEAGMLAEFTKIQILRQSGMALIAQAQVQSQTTMGALA